MPYYPPSLAESLDPVDADILPDGPAPKAGSNGLGADSGHVHPGAFFDARSYPGLDPSGALSSWAAIQAMLNAVRDAGGGVGFLPPGTFLVDAQLTLYNKTQLVGSGRGITILKFTDFAGPVIYCARALFKDAALAADLKIGDRTMTVAAGHGANYGNGTRVWLSSNLSYDGTTPHTDGTWISEVVSAAGDVVTLVDASPIGLTVANGAAPSFWAQAAPMLVGVRLADFSMVNAVLNPATNNLGIHLNSCDGALVERIGFRGSTGECIRLSQCYDSEIRNCEAEYTITGGGVGIDLLWCTGCAMRDNVVRDSIFGMAAYASPLSEISGNRVHGRHSAANYGRGIKCQSACHGSLIARNRVSDVGLIGIGTWDSIVTIEGNDLRNIGTDVNEHGIQCAGYLAGGGDHCVVSGNRIRNTAGHGIFIVGVGFNEALYAAVTGNVVQGPVGSAGGAGAGYAIGLAADRCVVVGNVLTDYGPGNFGVAITGQGGHATIIGNTTYNGGSGYGIYATGGSGHSVVHSNNLLGEVLVLDATDIGVGANSAGHSHNHTHGAHAHGHSAAHAHGHSATHDHGFTTLVQAAVTSSSDGSVGFHTHFSDTLGSVNARSPGNTDNAAPGNTDNATPAADASGESNTHTHPGQ